MKLQRRLVVITDVDGCLVDHTTYSHSAADPAVERLNAAGVPLVLCSSKTRAELERLREELELTAPFIVENGGALYVPVGTVPFSLPGAKHVAGYDILEFGRPHGEVLAKLLKTAGRLGIEVATFSGMSVQRVAEECGLSLASARLAKLREYDEPFRLAEAEPLARTSLIHGLRRAGLRCSVGGRYDHVTAGTDKGKPVASLQQLYKRLHGAIAVVGLGDSLNDLELLAAVDVPIIVRNAAGGHTEQLARSVPVATVTTHEGPAGWSEAVTGLLDARARPDHVVGAMPEP